LEEKASILRKHIIQAAFRAGGGHLGGSLSAVEIITALYFKIMHIRPENPNWEDRDRFVLSKGHGCLALYAALAERSYFPPSKLNTFTNIDSMLQGHPDMRKTPGIDMSSGALGQGLSVGIGMALGGKLDNKDYYVFVLLSDGEVQEGQVSEAAITAPFYKLDNLIAIIDRNKFQLAGPTAKIMPIEPLRERWELLGWHVRCIDGHNMREILEAIEESKEIRERPSVIIAETTKGKGVSFMEGRVEWHHGKLTASQVKQALEELQRGIN